jgi:monoamine oxidase
LEPGNVAFLAVLEKRYELDAFVQRDRQDTRGVTVKCADVAYLLE